MNIRTSYSKNMPNTWTMTEAAKEISKGNLTSEALVRASLARINARENQVGAWSYISYEGPIAEARKRDGQNSLSPLHGIPFGIKDIIDTADMPTGCGSPIYDGVQPARDASCVAILRESGCVALGKTVTTEFATRFPGKTRNPLDLERTPGGSSSGSAAAVADFMVPVAYGTQTTGSIIRPGAYCGVVAVKPTYGLINRSGVKELSDFLDTVGYYTRTVEDAALFLQVVGNYPPTDFAELFGLKPRIAICRTPKWDRAHNETINLFEGLGTKLRAAGAETRDLVLPREFDYLAEAQAVINEYESVRALAYERVNYYSDLSPELRLRFERSQTHTYQDRLNAIDISKRCQTLFSELIAEDEVVLAPAAQGIAEVGQSYTGDPIFSQVWHSLHIPAVCVPAGISINGMPLGAQIIAHLNQDSKAFIHAEWVRRALDS